MSKKILIIAFHYPPAHQSSGVQRTLKFSQYLPDFGWQPSVLTVNERAYPSINVSQEKEIPGSVRVIRASCIDSARHLAIKKRYPKVLSIPDRWISWWFSGVKQGVSLVNEIKPDFIFSTYPIATAHLIAYTIHKKTNVPWIADFRDSMTEDDYPTQWLKRKVYRWIENKTILNSQVSIFTTQGALNMYKGRYSDLSNQNFYVIENGYDENNFSMAEKRRNENTAKNEKIVMLHSGLLYPSERNPIPFFDAIAKLKEERFISKKSLKIILRASGHETLFMQELQKRSIGDIVYLEKGVSYQEALEEMLSVDALLIFQAKNCNHQIPAKIYEYFRANKPIFAITDKEGNTASLLTKENIGKVVQLDDASDIKLGIKSFIDELRKGGIKKISSERVAQYSRYQRTKELADILNNIEY